MATYSNSKSIKINSYLCQCMVCNDKTYTSLIIIDMAGTEYNTYTLLQNNKFGSLFVWYGLKMASS